MKNNCNSCVYRDNTNKVCKVLNNISIGEGNYHCPLYAKALIHCGICGQAIINNVEFVYSAKGDGFIAVCPSCSPLIGTCRTCEQGSACDYETNPSPLPKIVTKTIQNGSVTQRFNTKNPARIRETCQKNCPCFSQENDCLKQNNYCKNYREKY